MLECQKSQIAWEILLGVLANQFRQFHKYILSFVFGHNLKREGVVRKHEVVEKRERFWKEKEGRGDEKGGRGDEKGSLWNF